MSEPPRVRSWYRTGSIDRGDELDEVLAVSDRITLLRDTRKVAEFRTATADAGELARMMVGREVNLLQRRSTGTPGEPALTVRSMTVVGDRGFKAVRGIDLDVRSGEIVGIAGVAGNGQRELAEALAGLRKTETGTVILNEADITHASPFQRIRSGLGFVPEDRLGMGLAGGLSLEANLILKSYRWPPHRRGLRLASRTIRQDARRMTERFDIRGRLTDFPVRFLSGGNLQRAILARELSQQPKVLIAGAPTRGLDIGAIGAVRELLLAQRENGTAILLLSEDLDELHAMADVILVMYEGRIVGRVMPDRFDSKEIGLMMSGSMKNQG